MKRTIILTLILALTLLAALATADDTTTTTLGTSTTTTVSSTTTTTLPAPTTATTLESSSPVAPGTSIRSGTKNIILDDLNLVMDTISNYKRDRFLLSRNYSTYINLIRDNRGKDNTSSKSVWSDINDLENKTLPGEELQLDKLIKQLRNYVQDLN